MGRKDIAQENVNEGACIAQLRHDLMNPLTVVLGYAELLSKRDDLSPDARTQLTKLMLSANDLAAILQKSKEVGCGN